MRRSALFTSKSVSKATEGFAVQSAHGSIVPIHYDLPDLTPFDVHVAISHCGICHSDLHLIQNDWGNATYPLVPGHEIVGIVQAIGDGVTQLKVGDRVGIGWQCGSCGTCGWCQQGEQNLCAQEKDTCLGHFGGFAKAIVVDSRFAIKIPEKLPSDCAAPLLCGGATVFSPLVQHQVNGLSKVGVIGIGGLGHLALQFTSAFGCEVTAFSSSPHKEEEARSFGAHHFLSSKDPKALKQCARLFDLLLCTSSEKIDYGAWMQTLAPKGKLCILGAPKGGTVQLPVFDLISGRKTICGSNIASPFVIHQMLEFAALHELAPKIELFPMHEAQTALERLAQNTIRYRAVLYNDK